MQRGHSSTRPTRPTRLATSRLLAAASTLAALALGAGCANDGAPPPRLDGGPDTGSASTCGDIGQACCAGARRCADGTVCGPERSCCGVPGGAACDRASDCCGALDCVGSECCALPGAPCRSGSECCGESVCTEAGLCDTPAADCGGSRQACCEGDVCRGGFECVEGACVACGEEGAACCRPPDECGADLVCTGGTCEAPSGACGRDGQPCCDGTSCTGVLRCMAGTCAAPPEDCGYATCGACVADPGGGCGFCAATGACMPGGSGGPSAGTCGSGWQFGASASCTSDPDSCPSNTDCDACTRDPSYQCGWCAGAGTCRRGTSRGPTDGSCAGSDWSWVPSACGGSTTDRCATHAACGPCTSDTSALPYCGWCATSSTCRAGNSAGPTDGSCAGSDWGYYASACASTDACAALTTCTRCTDLGDTLDCGWCGATGTCHTGNATGPTTGTCGGDWRRASCTGLCQEVTQSCAADGECCRGMSCRRGVSFSSRCCVEAFGICAFGSDCCGTMGCSTGYCRCRTAGESCLANADCCSSTCSIPGGSTTGSCVGG